jgi:hypothetical protein
VGKDGWPMLVFHMVEEECESGRNKRIKRGFSIVWMTVIWVLWRIRNDRIFNNGINTTADAIATIQRVSWQWFLNYSAKSSCLVYEWIWDSGECMVRG